MRTLCVLAALVAGLGLATANSPGQLAVPFSEGFNGFDTGTRPSGWTFEGCQDDSDTYTTSGDYGLASPSIKMDGSGGVLIKTDMFSNPSATAMVLSFWGKGMSTGDSSNLYVWESTDGVDWSLTTDLMLPNTAATYGDIVINPSSSYLSFQQVDPNLLAFDDVILENAATTTTTTTTTASTTTTTVATTTTAAPTTTTVAPTTTTVAPTTTTVAPTTTTAASTTTTVTSTTTTVLSTTTTTGTTTTTTTAITPPPYLVLAGGDYTGNGASDLAFFRPAEGLWKVRGLGRTYCGQDGDIPVSGDYTGNAVADIGYYRPDVSLWVVKGLTRFYFNPADTGTTGIPVPADYDGDGIADPAVLNPITQLWLVPGLTRFYFGAGGDIPVPGDYDGDMADDFAFYRPSTRLWKVRGITQVYFGQAGDLPVPGKYDWYGKEASPFRTQFAFFRPSTGLWKIRNGDRLYFNGTENHPLVGKFDGGEQDGPAVYRYDTSLWIIRGTSNTRVYFGRTGDWPVSR